MQCLIDAVNESELCSQMEQFLPGHQRNMWSCVILTHVITHVLVTQSCPALCNPMDCRLPGSSIHGISQARVLEWVAIFFSRGSSQPRDGTQVSCPAGRRFTTWAIREASRVNWLLFAEWMNDWVKLFYLYYAESSGQFLRVLVLIRIITWLYVIKTQTKFP